MPHYIIYDDKNGRPCMGGGFDTRSRAEDELREHDVYGTGGVYYSKYHDVTRATRSIKHQRIGDMGLEDGSKNIRHKRGENEYD